MPTVKFNLAYGNGHAFFIESTPRICYQGREFHRISGFKANYATVDTREEYWRDTSQKAGTRDAGDDLTVCQPSPSNKEAPSLPVQHASSSVLSGRLSV